MEKPMEENRDETERMEFRKLRIENGLLRQRFERLQEESGLLRDEVSAYTVDLEQTSVEPDVANLLLELRQRNGDIRQRLKEAYLTIDELTSYSNGKDDKAVQVDDHPSIEHIHILQEEVMEARTRDADYNAVIKDLRTRAYELEKANDKLKDQSAVQSLSALETEFSDVHAREIEANEKLKDTRQQIRELREEWEAFIAKQTPPNSEEPLTCKEIQQQIMGAIIGEADALAELKETSQRMMELETRNRVYSNQIRRQDEEYKKLQWQCDSWPGQERELQCDIRQMQHKVHDAEAWYKEDAILTRLKEAELLEMITDLKGKISEMESDFFEKWTQEELNKDEMDHQSMEDMDEMEMTDSAIGSFIGEGMQTENEGEPEIHSTVPFKSTSDTSPVVI